MGALVARCGSQGHRRDYASTFHAALAALLVHSSRHGACADGWAEECPFKEVRGTIFRAAVAAQQDGDHAMAAKYEMVLQDDVSIIDLCCGMGWYGDGSGVPGQDGGPKEGALCWPGGVASFQRYARCCSGDLRSLAAGPAPYWMRREIASDLRPWARSRIDRASLDAMEQTWGNVFCRFRVEGGRLRTCGEQHVQDVIGTGKGSEMFGQYEAMARTIRTLLANGLLFDGLDFFVSPHIFDYVPMPVPVFTKARAVFADGFLRVPSYELLGPWLDTRRKSQEEQAVPWEDKATKLFWRGGLRSYNSCPCKRDVNWPVGWRAANLSLLLMAPESRQPPPGDCQDLPHSVCGEASRSCLPCRCSRHKTNNSNFEWSNRVRLCQLSVRHPDLVDAKLSYVPEGYSDVAQRIEDSGYAAEYADYADQQRFRYLISTDGSTIDDTRVYWMLSSGSVVFKQITPLLPFGLPGLEPWVHFIPVREDLADLIDKIQWARHNDELCRAMAERAHVFAAEYFTQAQILHYVQRLLSAYGKLQGLGALGSSDA